MNGLGSLLIWSSVPITALAGVALVLERMASRRGPMAGAWVTAASLLVIVALTPLAICGLPHGVSWRMPRVAARAGVATGALARGTGMATSLSSPAGDQREGDGLETGQEGRLSWSWWARLREGAAREMSAMRGRTRVLYAGWGVFVLSGAAWWLIRLMLGFRGVRDCRQKSTSIADADLLAEVEMLRQALSIQRPVEAREHSSLVGSGAAAAGWLRPFVLLPRDWRSWSGVERRAVLAHEMAHIGRGDYVSGIVAQLGLVLHFYHPLLHWLVWRLRLHQELAADAQGARLAGGRRRYLVALSRMALRPNLNPLVWPASTFLPASGHLMRRIQMLREDRKDRTLSGVARVVTAIVLLAVGIAAVTFRGVAPARAAETPPEAATRTESKVERFDFSYMSPEVKGVYALRPAAIARVPGMRRYIAALGAVISKEIGLPELESIEQAVIEFKLLPRDRSKNQPGRIVTGDWVVRTVKDFAWKSPIKMIMKADKTPGELVEVKYENRIYYKTVGSSLFGTGACFYFPDARTLVCSFHEEHLRRQIKEGPSRLPEFLRGDDWNQVEGALVAVAIDNRGQQLKLDLQSDDPEDLYVAPLLQNASRWVAGLDAGELVKFRAIATCSSEKQSEVVVRFAQERIAMARAALAVRDRTRRGGKDELEDALLRPAGGLIPVCGVHRDGPIVKLSAEAKIEPEVLGAFFQELTP